MSDPYSTTKLAEHPDALAALRNGFAPDLLTVHLMPQNLCNHSCSFCSYRMPGNKNSEVFDDSVHLPFDTIPGLLDDFKALGVKGVEVTGGGEPTAYPQITELFKELRDRHFQVGLVTNGTLGHKLHDDAFGRHVSWVRVSIDAGKPATYQRMREASYQHFDRAWAFVKRLAGMRDRMHPDFKLGVGFVLSNENLFEIGEFLFRAKEAGADNVRLTVTFSDKHRDYYDHPELAEQSVRDSVEIAARYEDDTFAVHNLMPTRFWEIEHPAQDYKRCPTKDLLCVVEGEGNVFSCCTFTGSKKGLWGNYLTHPGGFRGVWEETQKRRLEWDSRVECQVSCLYRDRNLAMNKLIDEPQCHTEFI